MKADDTKASEGILVLMTSNEAAAMLRCQPQTMRAWRVRGTGPRYVRIGGPKGRAFYRIADLEEWIAGRTHRNTSEETAARTGSPA